MTEAEKTEQAIRNALGELDRIDDDLGGALEFALYGQERAPAPQWDEVLGYLAKARARSGSVRKGLSRESGVIALHKRAPSFELKVNSDTREAVGEKIHEARKLVLQTAGLMSEVMTVIPLSARAENARAAVEHGRQCLLLLVRENGPELAAMLVSEERPTETELPEEGLTRNIRGLEVVTRALAYLENARDELERHVEATTAAPDAGPGGES